MTHTSKTTNRALSLIFVSIILSWLVYSFALWVDLKTIDDSFNWMGYLIFLAIAILSFSALGAKVVTARISATTQTKTFTQGVYLFATTVTIISLALSLFAVFIGFIGQIFNFAENEPVIKRFFNAYLPIVLYAALIVTVILLGFVFNKSFALKQSAEISFTEAKSAPSSPKKSQQAKGLAFTFPIVSAALALIVGLIVYDLTRTYLEAWIWVIIIAIIAAGIMLGVNFSKKAKSAGMGSAADSLNLVLAIVFASIVTITSLGFTAGAVSQLRVQHSLSIDVYTNSNNSFDGVYGSTNLSDVEVYSYADGMKQNSELSLNIRSAAGEITELAETKIGSSGFTNLETNLPDHIDPGLGHIVLSGTNKADTLIKAELAFEALADDQIRFLEGSSAFNFEESVTVMKISIEWISKELLPPFILLILVITVLYSAVRVRNI